MKMWNYAGLMLLALLGFTACEKEDQIVTDEALIEEIAFAEDLQTIAVAELPAQTRQTLDELFFDTFVEEAFQAPQKGYQVDLVDGQILFFNKDGRMLNFDRPHRPDGGFGDRHPHGHCFRPAIRFGQPVEVSDLPDNILTYIADNYPDNEAVRAKTRSGHYIVLVNVPVLLHFDENGDFVGEVNPIAHCRPCRPLGDDVASDVIRSYIQDNFPDASVARVCGRLNRVVVLLRTPDGRVLLIFDNDGNLLHQRP